MARVVRRLTPRYAIAPPSVASVIDAKADPHPVQPEDSEQIEVVLDDLQLGHLLKTVEVLETSIASLSQQMAEQGRAMRAQIEAQREHVDALRAAMETQQNTRAMLMAEARGLVRGVMIPVALAGGALAAGGNWVLQFVQSMGGR